MMADVPLPSESTPVAAFTSMLDRVMFTCAPPDASKPRELKLDVLKTMSSAITVVPAPLATMPDALLPLVLIVNGPLEVLPLSVTYAPFSASTP